MESGLPRPADFGEEYDSVSDFILAEYVAENLRFRYEAELYTPPYHIPDAMRSSIQVCALACVATKSQCTTSSEQGDSSDN